MARRPRPRRLAPAAVALATLLALTACSGDEQPAAGTDGPTPEAPSDTQSATGPSDPSDTASTDGQPQRHLLDWQPVPGPVDTTVTRTGRTTLAVDEAGTAARITAPGGGTTTISADARQRISDALLDGDWAVVVLQDRQESRPSVAQVVNVADDGRSFTLDGGSDIPTVNGGTWAIGDGHLLHATIHEGRYCAATVDLDTATSTLGWCAPKRHGFNSARITPYGDALLTFDDSQPSCRTVARMDGTRLEPFPAVADCKAWEGLLTSDGAVWSVIPKERQVEESHVYARSGDGEVDLGPAVAGSLTWCGDAAWFARDPQTDSGPAQLLRWSSDTGLEVVYETTGGHAFVDGPRCGGDTITLTALAEGGDEQVSASVD